MQKTYDALAFSGEFDSKDVELFRPFTDEERKLHHERFGKTVWGISVCRTPENLDYSKNEEMRGLKFFWRSYPLAPEFQPHHFVWTKVRENLYGGMLKDETLRTRTTLPPSSPTLVLR